MSQKLYRAMDLSPQIADDEIVDEIFADDYEPEGWAEYCQEMWGKHRKFFFPSVNKIYRSRSGAQARVDLINRWGGAAVLVEADVDWVTVEEANRRREARRLLEKRRRLMAEVESIDRQIGNLDTENEAC